MTIAIEIVHADTDEIIVCDTLENCIACDDGLREEEDAIRLALWRGEFYMIGGGAAAAYFIRPAPTNAIVG